MKKLLSLALLVCAACGAKSATTEDATAAADDTAAGGSDSAVDIATDVSVAYPELQPTICAPAAPIDLLGFDPKYPLLHTQPESTMAWVQDKNWYLLTVLQLDTEARSAIAADPTLTALAKQRDKKLRDAEAQCAADATCLNQAVAWTPDEITATAAQVGQVLAKTAVVKNHLRPSGRFALYVGKEEAALATQATIDALTTLQNVYNGYESGRPDLAKSMHGIVESHATTLQFFEPLLLATLDGMKSQDHDQAGRDEPLAQGENKAALARLKTIDWSQWRFTVVLGLGWGPEDDQPLSQLGREHADVVASRFQAGLAPFILLSGGHVHPSDKTPYSEALEMKKYLMAKYQIPEDAILVDPHARHTTTNMRNIARQMMVYGIPLDKPGLYSSDVAQVFYVLHLDTRCKEDLGYVPYRTVQSLGENDNCFLPAAESMFYDARDERDP